MRDYLILKDFENIFFSIRDNLQKNIEYLSKLDSYIGDGDHGVTIFKGFNKIAEEIQNKDIKSISELFIFAGNTLILTLGGTTGPVFGSMIKEMGKVIKLEQDKIYLEDIYRMFYGACEISMKIGRGAKPGEKTMVDALYPAVVSLKTSLDSNLDLSTALKKMSEEAKNGAESTKEMIATKGRAQYLKEKSIGYMDAGAASVAIIIDSFHIESIKA